MITSWLPAACAVLACGSATLSAVHATRLLRMQKRAYDFAADTASRSFGVEMAARRALAVWELGAWHDTRLGTPGWTRLSDAFQQLQQELNDVDAFLAGPK